MFLYIKDSLIEEQNCFNRPMNTINLEFRHVHNVKYTSEDFNFNGIKHIDK